MKQVRTNRIFRINKYFNIFVKQYSRSEKKKRIKRYKERKELYEFSYSERLRNAWFEHIERHKKTHIPFFVTFMFDESNGRIKYKSREWFDHFLNHLNSAYINNKRTQWFRTAHLYVIKEQSFKGRDHFHGILFIHKGFLHKFLNKRTKGIELYFGNQDDGEFYVDKNKCSINSNNTLSQSEVRNTPIKNEPKPKLKLRSYLNISGKKVYEVKLDLNQFFMNLTQKKKSLRIRDIQCLQLNTFYDLRKTLSYSIKQADRIDRSYSGIEYYGLINK